MKRISTVVVILSLLMHGCLASVNSDDDGSPSEGDYPRLELTEKSRSSAVLQNFNDCDTLLQTLQQNLLDEMAVLLDQESYWHWANPNLRDLGGVWFDDAMMEGADTTLDSNSETSPSREGDYSVTNNQESGVDEADFLKTDGFHTYMLNGPLLLIMGIPEFGQINLLSTTHLEGSPISMMIEGDTMVVASSIYGWQLEDDHPLIEIVTREYTLPNSDQTYTHYRSDLVKYSIIDITDRNSPSIKHELYLEGYYNTARLVDGTVRSITHAQMDIWGLENYVTLPDEYWLIQDVDERMDVWNSSLLQTLSNNRDRILALTLEDLLPQRYALAGDEVIIVPYSVSECGEYAASSDSVARGFLSIVSFDISDDYVSMEVDHIASSWAHVYASPDALVFAEPANDWWWFWGNDEYEDATNIHVFDISQPGTTSYVASGRVSGTVQDQFSISEFRGAIRVASTTDAWGRWWISDSLNPETDEPVFSGPSNRVTILQPTSSGTLDQMGLVEGIADGERIWSARFMGDRAYLVTFETIDPLWVLDLSDPVNPIILGELEVPGVSTYIHPIDESTLLTIGIGPGDDGLGLDWSMTQISLFDITDPTNPTLADSLPISPAYADDECQNVRTCGWAWSWSEATYEHKAFTYWAPEKMLAVPLSTYRYVYDENYYDGGYEHISLLKLIDVDAENLSLSEHGEIDHSSFYNDEDGPNWWLYSTSIRRSIFMGDYIYAFSTLGVTIHNTSDLTHIQDMLIPGSHSIEDVVEGESEQETSGPSGEDEPCPDGPEGDSCRD